VLTVSPAIETSLGTSTLQMTTSSISSPTKITLLPLTVLNAVAPTFRVRVLFPTLVTPVGGGTVESALGIPRGGGLTAPVTLSASGLPLGVVAEFSPAVVTGTSSIVRLTATPGTTPGIYPITVRGVATGLADRTVPVSYIVSGFRLFPATVSVKRGGSAEFSMGTVRYGNFSELSTVVLSRATPGFAFTGLPFTNNGTSGLLGWAAGVTVDQSVAPGVYTIDIEARSQSQRISTSTITVTVTN
jgi:hypothetical protein